MATGPLVSYLQRTSPDKIDSGFLAYLAALTEIAKVAPETASSIVKELADQRANLKLIASENYSSLATLLAMGNLLTDKYAEGYRGHRFYAGCDNVDTVESHGRRARPQAVRRRARLRPAALRRRRQPGRLLGDPLGTRVEAPALERPRTSRTSPSCRASSGTRLRAELRQPAAARHGLLLRRPPDPRLPPQHLRPDVRRPQLHGGPRDRPARLRRDRGAGARRSSR